MACWSSENATKAYLQALKMVSVEHSSLFQIFSSLFFKIYLTYLIISSNAFYFDLFCLQGKRGKEPDVAEFISALAAGNNAQLMVMACSRIATSTTIALVAAAHQTGGRVVCIFTENDNIPAYKNALGPYAKCIEFVKGDAENLLMKDYKGADFVLIDCNINGHKSLFRAAKESVKQGLDGGLIVGYNALHNGSSSEFETHFLPIGEGLLVSNRIRGNECGERKKSRWVVTVDKCTGEEHVFRITSSPRKESEA